MRLAFRRRIVSRIQKEQDINPLHCVTVLFSGEYREILGAHEFFDDTWECDGVSWKKVTIDGPAPSAKSRHAMCYDNLLRQEILFGGNDWDSFLGDV